MRIVLTKTELFQIQMFVKQNFVINAVLNANFSKNALITSKSTKTLLSIVVKLLIKYGN